MFIVLRDVLLEKLHLEETYIFVIEYINTML